MGKDTKNNIPRLLTTEEAAKFLACGRAPSVFGDLPAGMGCVLSKAAGWSAIDLKTLRRSLRTGPSSGKMTDDCQA